MPARGAALLPGHGNTPLVGNTSVSDMFMAGVVPGVALVVVPGVFALLVENFVCRSLTFPFDLHLFVAMGITGKPLTEIARSVPRFRTLLLFCPLMTTCNPASSTCLPSILR